MEERKERLMAVLKGTRNSGHFGWNRRLAVPVDSGCFSLVFLDSPDYSAVQLINRRPGTAGVHAGGA
jgi:hypothetical protein